MSNLVIFVSADGMTDPLGRSQVIPYLSGLTAKNFNISIVSLEKRENYEAQSNAVSTLLKDNNINWVPVPYGKSVPLFSQFYNVYNLYKAVLRILKPGTLIHCRSYLAALIGQELKRKFNNPFLFDMRGFWADERIDGKIWRLSNPIHKWMYNYFKKKEKEFIRESNHIISLTNNAKQEICKWNICDENKITVIPCCADLEVFDYKKYENQQRLKQRLELGLKPEDFVMIYLGSVGTWYLLPEMLQYFKVLKAKQTNAKFLIVTADNHQLVLDACNKEALATADVIVKKAFRNDVASYINCADISIFYIKPAYSKKASSPTKLAELLGMGLPVITNSGVGDIDQILRENKCGTVLQDFSIESVQKSIEIISELIKIEKSSLYQIAKNNFSLEIGVNRYLETYRKILN